jgi:hypothetical protein
MVGTLIGDSKMNGDPPHVELMGQMEEGFQCGTNIIPWKYNGIDLRDPGCLLSMPGPNKNYYYHEVIWLPYLFRT